MSAVATRTCSSLNRVGEPCKAHPLRNSDHCLAHNEEARVSAGFGGTQPGAGRPPRPRVVDILTERIEQQFDAWVSVLEKARDATKVQYVETGGEQNERIEVPDFTVQLAAFREAFDRAYGKPTQRTETEHSGGFNITSFFGVEPLAATNTPIEVEAS